MNERREAEVEVWRWVEKDYNLRPCRTLPPGHSERSEESRMSSDFAAYVG